MSHTVLPKMLQSGGGYIINLSSGISFTPFPMLMVYSATKVKGRRSHISHLVGSLYIVCACMDINSKFFSL